MAETLPPTENDADARYEVGDCVGRGGLGAVWRAHDRRLGRWVALKRLGQPPGMTREQVQARVRREASALAALQHPNIVTVHDFGADEQGPFVVMEFIEGLTLDAVVETAPLDRDSFFSLVEQTLAGVEAAHRVDLLHRDLKPGNLMLAWPPGGGGGDFQVKILDFGLAKFSAQPQPQTLDQGDSLFGSIYFMAPEQFRQEPLDARTDLYALGCIFYYALTGAHPFTGDTVAEIMSSHLHHRLPDLAPQRPDLPAAVPAWIMRLLAFAPDDRPRTAAAAFAEWRALTRGVPRVPGEDVGLAQAPSPSPLSPRRENGAASPGEQPPPRRARMTAVLAMTILLVAAGGGAYALWRQRQPRPLATDAAAPPPTAVVAIPAKTDPATPNPAVMPSGGPTPMGDAVPPSSLPAATAATPPPASPGALSAASSPPSLKQQLPVPSPPTPSSASPGAAAAAAVPLEATDTVALRARIGETVEVRGTPVAAGRSKSGTVLYLNFSSRPREALALVFFTDRLAVAGGGAGPPLREPGDLQPWIGKPLRVRGQVSDYKGDLQIVINSLDQLQSGAAGAARER